MAHLTLPGLTTLATRSSQQHTLVGSLSTVVNAATVVCV